ncbi:MAG: hypothetical protein R2702_06725 [Acidimicrobiales bacterium]
MLTLHRHHEDPTADTWADGHAAPEDRALGLELELIELHRRRAELSPDHPEVARVDREVQAVLDELVAVTAELSPSPAPHLAA